MSLSTSSRRRFALLAVAISATACTPAIDGGANTQALGAGDAGPVVAAELSPAEESLATRGVEPDQVLTTDQRIAQAAIDEGLTGLLSRCGRETPLACASESELIALGQAGRTARGASTRWETELAVAGVVPTPEHRVAIAHLADASIGDFAIEYNSIRGTPGRLDQVGFVRRPLASDTNSAIESWRAMLAAHRSSMDALYGANLSDELELVEQMRMGSLELLRFRRVVAGFVVESDTLDALVTNETASVGPGVVWRIQSSWSTTASRLLAGLSRATLLSEAEAKRLVGLAPDAGNAQLHTRCGVDHCTLTWFVDAAVDARFGVDAVTGEITGPYDIRQEGAGSVTLATLRPGAAGVLTTSRFRGARFRQGGPVIGNTDRTTGAYSNPAPDPWTMAPTGGNMGSPWMSGRVDRRDLSMNVVEYQVAWTPTTQPNRNFGSPDAWPPNPATMQHGTEIAYSWLTYWTDLFRTSGSGGPSLSQVVDTASFVITPFPVPGFGGGSTVTLSTGVPGSGQSSWGQMFLTWPSDDGNLTTTNVPPSWWMGLWAHEFGHTIGNCAATAGSSCDDADPGAAPGRPAVWTDYKRQVYGAHIENLASFLSAFLNEWQDTYNGGSAFFESNFRYGGYQDTSDTFGTQTSDSAGGINCSLCGVDPTKCCPPTHLCRTGTNESPISLTAGICARMCTPTFPPTPPLCAPGENDLTCAPFAPSPTGGVCWNDDYNNNWFTTVGTRLVFDSQWNEALPIMLGAQAGSGGNYARDFNLGTDSMYATMANFNFDLLEVTRAVRSATNEPGVTSRDDFTNAGARALPITVTDVNGTTIWWGSGVQDYPQINDTLDSDYVMFRGVAGSSYTVNSTAFSSPSLAPTVAVYRWTPAFTSIASATGPAGGTASATTGALAATDWYVAAFGGIAGLGRYTARIRLTSTTNDDFPAVSAEAYPLVTGVVQSGWLTAFDRDRFQIYVKTPTTTSLSVVTTSTPAPTVEIRTSAGVLVASGTGSATAPSATTGFYLVDVWDPAGVARGYSVTATIGCAAGSNCDDLTTAPATAARYTWGDRFGGRLPSGASTATYTVALNANENAVFSLADNSTTSCQLALDLTPPATLVYFNNKPVFSWNDLPAPFDDNGPAAGNRGGFRRGAGGHVTAPITGTYTLTVRRQNPGVAAACHYRLFVGHSTILSTARPQW